MTAQNRTTLKNYFLRGLRPTQSNYSNLIDSFPLISGDTMTGPLVLSGDPSAALGAATKQYVDASVSVGGAPFTDTTAIVKGSVDSTKQLRFEVDGFTAGTTRVATMPDKNGTVAMTSDMGMVLLSTATASSSTSVVFTANLDTTYDTYLIVGSRIQPATDAVYMLMRYSIDGGATYLNTSYVAQTGQFKGAATSGTAPADGIHMTPNTAAYFVKNFAELNFQMYLHNPGLSGACMADGSITYLESASLVNIKGFFSGDWRGGSNPINAIQFTMSSGNITGGFFYLYGLKKS